MVKEKILKFVVKASNPMELMDKLQPNGRRLLNRTEWRGKEPRSCGITKMKGRRQGINDPKPFVFDVEVSYRPKGYINFVGNTKYDGWTAMMLDRQRDGTLLDGKGQPLKDGEKPVELPFKAYADAEFNEMDFGEFVGEFESEGVKRTTFEEVAKEIEASGMFNMSVRNGNFAAARRSRPHSKIVITSEKSGTYIDGFGTHIINVNKDTPHLDQVLVDRLNELVSNFIEGKVSIVSMFNDDVVYLKLSDTIVDATPNEHGLDSWFDAMNCYVPVTYLEELAKRLMATYRIDVSVVEGGKAGLVIRHAPTTEF